MKIWFVTPCYFDVESFRELRKRCLLVSQKFFPDLEPRLILIDDSGGQDPQVQQQKHDPLITVITPPYNLGHQGAIVFALRSIALEIDVEDYVVTLDCDGEDKPEDIPALLKGLDSRRSDLYALSLAQRTRRNETVVFKLLYTFFKVFFTALSGVSIKSGNFAAFRGGLAKSVVFHPYFDYCYSSSLVALPLMRNHVPLARGTRYFGKSKMNLVSLVAHGLRMLLPFSESIAIRGIMFFALIAVAGAAAILMTVLSSLRSETWLVAVESITCLFGVLASTISFVFFATFHQTRAISLRNWNVQPLIEHDEVQRSVDDSLATAKASTFHSSKTNIMSGIR